MDKLEIYRLAYEALLIRYGKECCQPLGPIRKHRIAELDKKIAELHQELLVLEKQNNQ